MLTVKHISLSGIETIYPASSVEFRPAATKDCAPASDSVLAFTEQHYVVAELTGGTVFVMNEHGKTVSRYDLGASMVPMDHRGDDGRAARAA